MTIEATTLPPSGRSVERRAIVVIAGVGVLAVTTFGILRWGMTEANPAALSEAPSADSVASLEPIYPASRDGARGVIVSGVEAVDCVIEPARDMPRTTYPASREGSRGHVAQGEL